MEDQVALKERTTRIVLAERFALRSLGALGALAVVGAAFGLLAASTRLEWAPLRELDVAVADGLNGVVSDNRVLEKVLLGVTQLGGTPMLIWLLVVGVGWLLLRRQPRLAVYVAVTSVGAMVLTTVVKALIGRLRPVVDAPVYSAPGMSFPSGHALGSMVSYGVVLLVFGPLAGRVARRVFEAVVAAIVVVVGFSRIALGAHYLTDVVAGWLLGALWLVLTALAFHRWRQEGQTRGAGALPGQVPPGSAEDLRPVPRAHPPTLPHPWQGLGALAVTWVLVLGALVVLGKLVSDGPAGWDSAVVAWFADRGPAVLDHLDDMGDTPVVLAGALVVGPLAVAVTRSWRPALFLATALGGEITLFLTATAVVDRPRPEVAHLDPALPPTSSFPSGHVAATVVLYAATAMLVCAVTDRWWRWAFVALAVAMPALVAVQRLHAGAHHPTDVLGSLLLALPWLFVAWRVLGPVNPRSPRPTPGGR